MKSLSGTTEDFRRIIRPKDIFKEVRTITLLIYPRFNFDLVVSIYDDIIKLFNGEYAGYLRCDTDYHNLRHTQECLLEMARLIHGAFLNGCPVTEKDVGLGLISAIMHDTGYIKATDEGGGTGGKFTVIHIDRSISFAKEYLTSRDFSSSDILYCKNCLRCTGLTVKVNTVKFISPGNELMGKILGTADLAGQMSDPFYLKKLPTLFKEFQEAGISLYEDEFDLLEKTPGFWEFTKNRFADELGSVDRYLRDHFRERWGIDRDLSREAIEKNIQYLKYILQHHRKGYRRFLNRRKDLIFSDEDFAMPPP